MLHKETVSKETMELIHKVMKDPKLKEFFLVGGTSLSLRLGHRESVDIDLFSQSQFNKQELEQHFYREYNADLVLIKSNGISVTCGRENIDLLHYPVPMVEKPEKLHGIRMLSVLDVAAMKVNAIAFSDEASRPKDFADLYKILERHSMVELIETYIKKYPDLSARDVNKMLNLENVKNKQVPLYDKKVTWEKIEKRFKQAMLFPMKVFKQDRNLGRGL